MDKSFVWFLTHDACIARDQHSFIHYTQTKYTKLDRITDLVITSAFECHISVCVLCLQPPPTQDSRTLSFRLLYQLLSGHSRLRCGCCDSAPLNFLSSGTESTKCSKRAHA